MKIVYFILILLLVGCNTSKSLLDENTAAYKRGSDLFPIKYEELWGYADFYGNIVVKPSFQEANLFQYGIAVVKLDCKYGYLKNNGEWLIEPKFFNVEDFYLRFAGLKGIIS